MKLSEVKKNMHKSVLYDGSIYWLQSCVMWLDELNHEFKYSLVLIDKNQVLKKQEKPRQIYLNFIVG